MEHFCTYFNSKYTLRAMALYRSMKKTSGDKFVLWTLCLDEEAYAVVDSLQDPQLRPISLTELEAADSELLASKSTRSSVEYIFTLTPAWMDYLLHHHPSIERLTYLDADLFFFADYSMIFDEMGANSIAIIEHKFPPHLRHLEIYGRFNVGLIAIRNDINGNACVDWWRSACIEWCYDRIEGPRFADQKYLDVWPEQFDGVIVLQHPGFNLGPWNQMQYRITREHNEIQVDGLPLVFYHFQSYRILSPYIYGTGAIKYEPISGSTQRIIYHPYHKALRETAEWIRRSFPAFHVDFAPLMGRGDSSRAFIRTFLYRQYGLILPPIK